MGASVQPSPPGADKIAELRRWVRTYTAAGGKLQDAETALRQRYGVGVKQVMDPNAADFGRSLAQGLTLGHADELAGLYAKLTGGDYTTARNQVRTNEQEAMTANPGANAAVQLLAGTLPGLAASLVPGLQPTGGAHLANAGRAALMGLGIGGIEGEGRSTASTAGGVARDAATAAAASGVLGGAAGYGASRLMGPAGAASTVGRNVATQMPDDPAAMQQTLAFREKMVPGSVVLADASPEMRAFVRGIGADQKVAMKARSEAVARLKAISDMRKTVGQGYDALQGVMAPVDPELAGILQGAGRKGLLRSNTKEIDLAKVHDVRSQLLAEARATRNMHTAQTKRDAAAQITGWLEKQMPALRQLDQDYALLTEHRAAAKETLKAIKNSSKNYAVSKAYDMEAGSVGGTIPLTRHGAVGTILHGTAAALKPNRAARARAVYNLLLSPQRGADGLSRLVEMHGLLINPPTQTGLGITNALLAGTAIPQAAGTVLQAP